MRAVIDTNVLVSGLLWAGTPHTLLLQLRDGALTLLSSPALLAEFGEVIARPKFKPVLDRAGVSPEQLLTELRQLTELVDPPPLPATVSRDGDDDALLALAVAAQADLLVTGDADLLVLGSYGDIPILTPAQALTRLASAPR